MKTLHSRLTAALLLLLTLSGGLFLWVSAESTRRKQYELTQRLHQTLARSLVAESPLLSDGVVDPDALEHVFHTLMVVNPSIEVYLLDATGRVLKYSAPAGRVVLSRVSLEPVARFLEPAASLPILGDDPRHPSDPKVFSAAPIEGEAGLEGYLYVVLQSELYASAAAGSWSLAVLRRSLGGLASILVFGAGAGLAIYLLLTRRLRWLGVEVSKLREGDFSERPTGLVALANPEGDEIEQLASSFHTMGERIVDQVQALRDTDEHRRQLIASVSHDLRTPLAALEGYLETLLLKGEQVSPAERRSYLEIARKSSARLSRLVDELFELAKLEATSALPDIEAFNLEDLLLDVLQKFQLRAREGGVEIRVEVDEDASFASAEIGMIERVFENLVDNALRHTPPEGEIRVHLSRVHDNVEVRVQDSGAGIPARDLPHIFDRFYRAGAARDTESGGAGLGLAIAKRIVELHRGTLRASSEVGVGTRFTFELPAAA